jgi:hypothetical protein
MATSLRITSVIIFFIGASLIVPKIADAAGNFRNLTGNRFRVSASNTLITRKGDSQSFQNRSFSAKLDSDYEPPNFGGPDSQHGSGTR